MEQTTLASSGFDRISLVVGILRTQLSELDQLGANKAAAHLDATIQQLNRDHPRTFENNPILQLAEATTCAEY